MTKIPLGAAAAATMMFGATGASAHPGVAGFFKHAATGYAVRLESNGREMCVFGTHPATGEKFRVHVTAEGHVTGTWNGEPVDFVVPDKRGRGRW